MPGAVCPLPAACSPVRVWAAGIMDMMKDMYDEGDDDMKKVIGEAMLKSKSGDKSMPTM